MRQVFHVVIGDRTLRHLRVEITRQTLPFLKRALAGLAKKVDRFKPALFFIVQTVGILIRMKMSPADNLAGLVINRRRPPRNTDQSL